jgi:hypothetical protein
MAFHKGGEVKEGQNSEIRTRKMNIPKVTFKTTFLALGCIALSSIAQAVIPAPDGGYPNGNTAEGQNALFSLTTGGYNTAVGFFSLRSDAMGSFNTAIGAGALLVNVGDPMSSGEGDQIRLLARPRF